MEVVIGRNMITGGLYTRPLLEIVLNKTLNFSIIKIGNIVCLLSVEVEGCSKSQCSMELLRGLNENHNLDRMFFIRKKTFKFMAR